MIVSRRLSRRSTFLFERVKTSEWTLNHTYQLSSEERGTKTTHTHTHTDIVVGIYWPLITGCADAASDFHEIKCNTLCSGVIRCWAEFICCDSNDLLCYCVYFWHLLYCVSLLNVQLFLTVLLNKSFTSRTRVSTKHVILSSRLDHPAKEPRQVTVTEQQGLKADRSLTFQPQGKTELHFKEGTVRESELKGSQECEGGGKLEVGATVPLNSVVELWIDTSTEGETLFGFYYRDTV